MLGKGRISHWEATNTMGLCCWCVKGMIGGGGFLRRSQNVCFAEKFLCLPSSFNDSKNYLTTAVVIFAQLEMVDNRGMARVVKVRD
jgi:hypothetical protein